jgi:hypothetical protein
MSTDLEMCVFRGVQVKKLAEPLKYDSTITQTCPNHLQEGGIIDFEQYEFTIHKKTLSVFVDGQDKIHLLQH